MTGLRNFLMRGNLIDLAIAFILGASFGDVVKAFTQVILDIVSLLGGNPNFDAVTVGPINVGGFITAVVSFVILAAILYFGVVRPYEAMTARLAGPEAEVVAAPTTEELLTEIRDLLRTQRAS